MPDIFLNNGSSFPPVHHAPADSPIAIGGDLSVKRLLEAYKNGIFPWYEEGQPILWWSPDPRFVLFPEALKVSRSMQSVIKSNRYSFTVNAAFPDVIRNCRTTYRPGQEGNSWITNDIEIAYNALHERGYAHSAEAWLNGELAGGLYGIRLGNIFFGESMFSRQDNASKFAFIQYITQLKQEGLVLVDCQVYTDHLKSMGAGMISRPEFLQYLRDHTGS